VPWKKLEVDAGGFPKGARVDAKASNIAHNKAQEFTSRDVKASKNILRVRFKCYSIMNQGRNKCFTRDAKITAIIAIRSMLWFG
jgi:hypothetical protein